MAKRHSNNKKSSIENHQDLIFDFDAIFADEKTNVEGLTTIEIAKKTGITADAARIKIKQAIDSGKMICCGKKKVLSMDGAYRSSPIYTVVKY